MAVHRRFSLYGVPCHRIAFSQTIGHFARCTRKHFQSISRHPIMGVTYPATISKRSKRIHPTISLLRPAADTSVRTPPVTGYFEISSPSPRKARLRHAPLTPPNSDLSDSSDSEDVSVVAHPGAPLLRLRVKLTNKNQTSYHACGQLEMPESCSSTSDSDTGSDVVRIDTSPVTTPEPCPEESPWIRRRFDNFDGGQDDSNILAKAPLS
ncbi:hypothetical protein V1504DRAFT_23860 [Lipomyces starkeyi]